MIGKMFGHYRIESKLGEGGMGVVWKAEDLRLKRSVALKFLSEQLSKKTHAMTRFEREAQAASALNHAHICTIHEVGEAEGQAYIAMEYVEGRTLKELTAPGGLPVESVLRYGAQMAEALAHAHERGVVHRDLKSANVIITPEGQVKVLDFGLARRLPEDELAGVTRSTESLTEEGPVAGTLPYIAPEVLRGQAADARSDLWALGVVLYEMATGRLPFCGQSGYELSSIILRDPPPPLPAHVPAGLREVISRLLAKESGLRYRNAGEARAALEAVGQTLLSVPEAPRPAKMPSTLRRTLLAAGALLAVLVAVVLVFNLRRTMQPRIESLAVLPLANLSGDPAEEYFADGMTEAVIADLAKIKAMKVISRTSVMQYKNSKKSMREIASALNADAVVEGSVMRSADRVRITVELIDASSDQHLWAESYERDLKNVFGLQGEVAQAIAQHVRVAVTPQEQARIVERRPVDTEVYELYLKGRHIIMRGGLEDVQKAIEYFQSGLAKDPDNALIYTGLADAYIHKMSDVHESPVEATVKARAAAMKALELDESLAEAHTSLASIKLFYDWDWTGAEIELKRAMELNPGYSLAYRIYGGYLTMVGRHPEALPYFEKARRLDPLYERNYLAEGYSYFMARKYDESIEQYRKGFEIEPDPMTYFGLVLALAGKGDYSTAIYEAEKATKLNDSPLLLTSLASAYALAGRRADSNRVLRRLEEISKRQGPAPAWHGTLSRYVCPYEVAGVYAQLGDKDRAFEWLDKAYQSRSCLYWLHQDPRLDFIRSDPRFHDLLTKMKFPQ
jgi:serine/threonine-protein kinase